MAVLARGSISDRPWGQTLGALAKRGLSGQLTVTANAAPYRIAFSQGAIVGASSPLASDAAVRLALTGGLISSTQVADITRRVAAAPHRDEIDVIAEAARLAADQAQKLRRRLVAQRAARTFSVDAGEFVIEDQITVPVVPGSELDVRAVINLGARGNLSEHRLVAELQMLGVWFKLNPDAVSDLGQYGFTELDKPVLQELVAGANLADIEHDHPEVGDRGVRAIVYSLASYGACEVAAQEVPSGRARKPSAPPQPRSPTSNRVMAPEGVRLRTRTSTPPVGARTQTPTSVPRTATPTSGGYARANPPADDTTPAAFAHAKDPTGPHKTIAPPAPGRTTGQHRAMSPTSAPPPDHPAYPRAQTPQQIAARVPTGQTGQQPAIGRAVTGPPQPARTMTPMTNRAPSPGGPVISRTISQSRAQEPPKPIGVPPRSARPSQSPMPVRSRTNTAAQLETEALIRDRLTLVDRGADHFVLLGIAQDATPDLIRAAYFTLARKLHPDRLASLGIVDSQRDAQRLFAQINTAFAVLNDQVKRLEYIQVLERGGESAVKAEEAKADAQVMKVMHAEEAFRRGEMALRREQLDQAITEFTTAVELQPQEPEYTAMLVWAKFAAAPDKQLVAHKTRTELQRAAEKALQSPTARFYLGRVERILGREREALEHFYEVLRIKPNHAEASSEIRVLETRLKKR